MICTILDTLYKEVPINKEKYKIPLSFDPLAEPNPLVIKTRTRYADNDNQSQAKFDLKLVPITLHNGNWIKISPKLQLPMSITTLNPSLSTMNVPTTVVIMEATTDSITIGFRVVGSSVAYTLGGTQHALATGFSSGIIPAATGLDLPYLHLQTEARKEFLLHIPQAIQDAPAQGLQAFIKAAKAQKQSPYNQQDFPTGGTAPDKISMLECATVFASLKRKYKEIEQARPTKMRMMIASHTPREPNVVPQRQQAREDALRTANHEAFLAASREIGIN